MTVSRESLLSPEGGGDWQDQFLNPIHAKITAVQAGAGIYAGMNCYAWTEQILDPSQTPPTYKNADAPRVGTFTLSPAREKNNQLLTPPFFADIRPVTWSNGAALYEFESAPGGGGSGGAFVGCRIGGTIASADVPSDTSAVPVWSVAPPTQYDVGGFFKPATPTTLTIPKTGHYRATCVIRFQYSPDSFLEGTTAVQLTCNAQSLFTVMNGLHIQPNANETSFDQAISGSTEFYAPAGQQITFALFVHSVHGVVVGGTALATLSFIAP